MAGVADARAIEAINVYHLKAVIIGAGIGGLATGIAFKQAGYEVEIYDKASQLRPAGAGISLWSNGVKVLNRLGLGDRLAKIGGLMNQMQYRTQTGELLNDIDLHPLVESVGQRPYPVARTDLQQMLLAAFPGQVQLNAQCVAIEATGDRVAAVFANGHRAIGDLIVGADGIRSTVRRYVLEAEAQPRYGGYVNWNGLVAASVDLAPPQTWVIYVGDHKRASMMPVGDDRFYFFFDVPLLKGTQPNLNVPSELKAFFSGWAEPVQTLIDRLDPQQTNRLEIHDLDPLDRLVRGKVALLGDAGHATCPDLGQGGCQAIEDAEVLTRYLLTTNLGVEYALKRYEAERKERTAAIVLKARRRSEVIHGKEPAVTQQWYAQLRQESPEDVTNAISKIILAGPMR